MLVRTQAYAVDRLDGRLARLVSDDGTIADVPRRWLPAALGEGSVVRVALHPSGPDWATAQADEATRTWREALLELILEELRWRVRGSRVGCVPPAWGCEAVWGFADLMEFDDLP